jgi:hypothetical protein
VGSLCVEKVLDAAGRSTCATTEMRILIWLALALVPCEAWDTAPHRKITKAALNSLGGRPFGAETAELIDTYCIYPDRYLEMEQFGFTRKGGGPRTAAEIRVYCVRPDGQAIHGITGDRESDLQSLVYLFEQMARRPGEAAKFAGVLSHFVADSLSPSHAADAQTLAALAERYEAEGVNMHGLIEGSVPDIVVEGRRMPSSAEAVLKACYAGAERNRRDLEAIVRAASIGDDAGLNGYRLRAGTTAAGILADALAGIGQK